MTSETRRESYESLSTMTRQLQILTVLDEAEEPMTVRQIKERLGYYDMNDVRPRVTELLDMERIEVVGKKYDAKTDRMVTTYKIKENAEC